MKIDPETLEIAHVYEEPLSGERSPWRTDTTPARSISGTTIGTWRRSDSRLSWNRSRARDGNQKGEPSVIERDLFLFRVFDDSGRGTFDSYPVTRARRTVPFARQDNGDVEQGECGG
ncbi:hypothetical protein [Haladaptatus halobius]|uniref:hypothetical protein n=1 Tax=Haladaptatus halobius TaxID=2884875 RepID=UPI001D0B0FCD|nr:hypothetical protein [Haladaptatus halobius]